MKFWRTYYGSWHSDKQTSYLLAIVNSNGILARLLSKIKSYSPEMSEKPRSQIIWRHQIIILDISNTGTECIDRVTLQPISLASWHYLQHLKYLCSLSLFLSLRLSTSTTTIFTSFYLHGTYDGPRGLRV